MLSCSAASLTGNVLGLADDMASQGVQPDAQTYGRLLMVCEQAELIEQELMVLQSFDVSSREMGLSTLAANVAFLQQSATGRHEDFMRTGALPKPAVSLTSITHRSKTQV